MDLFDLHCDTLYECYETGARLRENALCIDRSRAAGYRYYAQWFALFCGARSPGAAKGRRCLLDLPPENRLDALLETARTQLRENADWLMLCQDADDLALARSRGKAAAFLSVEGAELLPTPEHVRRAWDAGVRMVTLAWNHQNAYACGAVTDDEAGLTAAGRALVHDLVQRGVILDVSHLSARGFWELCVETEAPLAATHSNSRALCEHPRNLTDLQFCELVRRGGLVGINLYSPFLRADGAQAGMADVIAHIEHFLALGGEHCLALGADFDGCDSTPPELQRLDDLERLAEALLRENYLEHTVRALFYDNAAAFVTRML